MNVAHGSAPYHIFERIIDIPDHRKTLWPQRELGYWVYTEIHFPRYQQRTERTPHKIFRCGYVDNLISKCPKPPKDNKK